MPNERGEKGEGRNVTCTALGSWNPYESCRSARGRPTEQTGNGSGEEGDGLSRNLTERKR